MNIFLINIALALAWTLLTGVFSYSNLILGLILGYIAILATKPLHGSSEYLWKIPNVITFAGFFLWELIKANIKVAYEVLTPTHNMRPGVISFNLTAKNDLEITLLMNLISLTPGTLSLDVSFDRKCLYIHAIYADDLKKFQEQTKELERRLLEVLR